MSSGTQSYNLLISHNQIQVRSREFDEASCKWGNKNLEQGAVIHDDYVVFDPLPDDTFGAYIDICFESIFEIDKNVQRCIMVPFLIKSKGSLVVASASEKFTVDLIYSAGKYDLYYEVCEGDEIYYRLTFVSPSVKSHPGYIIDDPWGGVKDKSLELGYL